MDKETIKTIITDIFKHTGCELNACEITDEGGMLWVAISTPDSRFLIGREGDTLKSVNHLVRKMLEKSHGEEGVARLFVDINGYQKKRFDNLKATAYMLAERARYFKSNIEVDPMPASERRIIHMFLEGAKDVVTESTGMGPNRKVVIKYVGQQL
jgi:spoIIIJ-associated protein